MKTLRDPKRKPTHPGEILREDVLPSLNMTQAALAKRLGVSRLSVSELLLEKRALSADMAVRVGKTPTPRPKAGCVCKKRLTCGHWCVTPNVTNTLSQ